MHAAMAMPVGEAAATDTLARLHGEALRFVRAGLLVFALGIVPAFAWLGLAPLASAVVAPAFVKVDLNRRPVQHAEGGIVREVKVRDGQRVAAGEPLVVLGDVSVDADLNRLGYRVNAERAGVARLEAEQVGLDAITSPSNSSALPRPTRGLPRSSARSARCSLRDATR